jgi:hypothetical protein
LTAGAEGAWIAGKLGEEHRSDAFARGSQIGQGRALFGAQGVDPPAEAQEADMARR